MLSLIICSTKSSINLTLEQNIEATIGCDYEIVLIDNSKGEYSIFEAYNLGVERAKGDILCFMHEDIIFHSKGWGATVEHHLADSKVGMLGVAGMKVVPLKGDARMGGYFCNNIPTRYTTLEDTPRHVTQDFIQPAVSRIEEVAALDGVWFCIPKSLFDRIRFDDATYKGFHIYDLDISLQVLTQHKKIVICNDIIIEHLSNGIFSEVFLENLIKFQEKWHSILPLQRNVILTGKQMSRFTKKAERRLNKRIKYDRNLVSLKKKQYKERKQNKSIRYTTAERKIYNRSIEQYMKVRFQTTSKRDACRIFGNFILKEQHTLKLRTKIMLKFIYYGIIHHKKKSKR